MRLARPRVGLVGWVVKLLDRARGLGLYVVAQGAGACKALYSGSFCQTRKLPKLEAPGGQVKYLSPFRRHRQGPRPQREVHGLLRPLLAGTIFHAFHTPIHRDMPELRP
jgi:hypothetical protein